MTDRTFRGHYLLIYFGYTSCHDVCPTTLSAVAAAMHERRADAVQPIFVSVDPAHDTPEIVRRYVAAFSPRLIGLTGTPAQIRRMEREYRVSAIVHHGPGEDTVDHSSVLYLMDPDGRFIAPIRADESGSEMAADIARYMS